MNATAPGVRMTAGELPQASAPLSRRKRVAFAMTAIVLVFGGAFAVVLGADLYVHRKAERLSSVNIWGYRGPKVGRKQPGESRLVVLGGSTAFGYGVHWDEAFPPQLEALLRERSRNRAPVTVVNLGMNTEGVYAFRFNLEDYLYLDYDAAIFYEGYNDHRREDPNYVVLRRDSPVFRLTGYYPILPVFLREKAMALRAGGDLGAAYAGKTVFKPNLADRTTAAALETSVAVSEALGRQLDRVANASPVPTDRIRVTDAGCPDQWKFYCGAMFDAIQFALSHGKKVLVVTQPYLDDNHRSQQAALRSMLREQFANNPRVFYADLGHAVDLHSRDAYDGMHLYREGNEKIARSLVAPVAAMMPEVFVR
jgi:hypothetical protein